MRFERFASWSFLLTLALSALACADEQHPPRAKKPTAATSTGTGMTVMFMPQPGIGCTTVHSAEPVPARIDVISDKVVPKDRTMLVGDLFFLFKSNCGACHVGASQGDFQVNAQTFPDLVDQKALDLILSDDKDKVMPPPPTGRPAKDRQPGDPVLQLLSLLQTWIAAGRPRDVFVIQGADQSSDVSPYLLSEAVGMGMTNIGDCVPNRSVVATDQAKSADLDTFFEGLLAAPPASGNQLEQLGIPEHLNQTDLYTLDTETLAHDGVIAYAPAYPLWSDNARKIRYVRVPKGQSITFDPVTQRFDIPANTRFYKTFLKRVIEKDHSERYQKIETRLIVSRPDQQRDDGTFAQTALFGTYIWNQAETDAVLLTDGQNNGEAFTDRLLTVVTDEIKAQEVVDSKPKDLAKALVAAGANRHYAIPGKTRCIQCHMGSPSQAFVLGFTPLQIRRRPLGEGGVIEPTGPDELTQLQRLIDYGVITGISSEDDIAPLEAPQGDRPPRNDYEVAAQGYMLGNCSHCHNPHGFPSVSNPVLTDLLNFLPGPDGGIFQFPLERTSPRISRGATGDTPIPYITPSLIDLPSPVQNTMWEAPPPDLGGRIGRPLWFVYAPWRSLIYRNVDTPFPYAADVALFPHMPMNVPGYDCRAPRILGTWMVSIPALRKDNKFQEDFVPGLNPEPGATVSTDGTDTSVQPYREVKPDEPGYEDARAGAEARLASYHDNTDGLAFDTVSGQYVPSVGGYARYEYCADTKDIVDPDVTGVDNQHLTPASLVRIERDSNVVDLPAAGQTIAKPDEQGDKVVMPMTGVPSRPHWVVTDVTEPNVAWLPKRSDWSKVLIDRQYTPEKRFVPELLNPVDPQQKGVTLSKTIRDFANTEIPFGLWKDKDGCDWSSVKTVADLTTPPAWVTRTMPTADSHVYMQLPGEAVYNMICVNCHGPNADSHGRQADTLLLMTGGDARVANFRNGLFGPPDAPGANRTRVFGEDLGDAGVPGVTEDDWSARYMAWMALGGTTKLIPSSILSVVANTRVVGVARNAASGTQDANMLSVAQRNCEALVRFSGSPHQENPIKFWDGVLDKSRLIVVNGDAELWQHVCALENPTPVRWFFADYAGQFHGDETNNFDGRRYPSDRPIGSGAHVLPKADPSAPPGARGIGIDVTQPWCIQNPTYSVATALNPTPKQIQAINDLINNTKVDGQPLPICPDELYPSDAVSPTQRGVFAGLTSIEMQNWIDRGAINAGLNVFLYLDQVIGHGRKPMPPYDRCEQLGAP